MQLHRMSVTDPAVWNSTLALMPYAHVLQTWEWGEFKRVTTGWSPYRIAFMLNAKTVAMAQVLTRRVGPLSIMYVPKGPAVDYANVELRRAVLDNLKAHAREKGAIFIKIDPDITTGVGITGDPESAAYDDVMGRQVETEWQREGLVFSPDQVQFRNSVILDLRQSEDELLAAMKQKTRYNVRLSMRRGVEVRYGTADDLRLLYDLYAATAQRDGFIIRPLEYYQLAWEAFMKAGLAQPIIAEYKHVPIAHLIIFGFARRAWYMYGASSDEDRAHMPTYLLQWEAIRWAKSQGMQTYDFWGAPNNFDDPNDPLAGVFRFKEGFGGAVVNRIGAWDYPARPTLYNVYTRVMPAVLNAMRGFARRRQISDANLPGQSQ